MSEEGSEESPLRPKRKIKKVMVLSDEGSDSSGSSVVCAGTHDVNARSLNCGTPRVTVILRGGPPIVSDLPKPTTSSIKPLDKTTSPRTAAGPSHVAPTCAPGGVGGAPRAPRRRGTGPFPPPSGGGPCRSAPGGPGHTTLVFFGDPKSTRIFFLKEDEHGVSEPPATPVGS
ncbi:unnamed protein product [Arctia plantaginis]|uniref:Uncharacterized protein n=1 Tax=Arctia plantaginis TaxID=874455 RepID=A0A8S1AWZ2_ARCPL|nr:unnamed protein product [Arctia plantaginis]